MTTLTKTFIEHSKDKLTHILNNELTQLIELINKVNPESNISKDSMILLIEEDIDKLERQFSHISAEKLDIIKKVSSSLSQIEIGLYGYCAYCENAIDKMRLEKSPYTQCCGQCTYCQKCGSPCFR